MHVALNRLELSALQALARLGPEAYGVAVREDIAAVTNRDPSVAAVYTALERLVRRGLVRTSQSEPRPERGGRARRQFELTKAGNAALDAERALMSRMWHGVPLPSKERSR